MSAEDRVVIIGAGQAGGQAAVSLRQMGYEGEILLVGDEAAPPYQRPPLSKAYLKGEMDRERLFLKPVKFYEDNNITLMTGKSAAAIDRYGKEVVFDDDTQVRYSKLIIATGSRPRPLPTPGANLGNVLDLRTLEDVDKLKPLVTEGNRVVIVGAGYIGLEAAAVARKLGLDVTVLEMAPRVLARVTSPIMSEFYRKTHESHGVKIMTDARMERLVGEGDKVTGAELMDGTILPADLVLVGIGILPNQEIAAEAGVECANGILVDENTLTSDENIYAIGDCAFRPLVHYGRTGRLESVHNAIEQGKLAAAHITGKPAPALDIPWFWSDQYDVKLQIAGLSQDYDTVVTRGDTSSNSFSVWYFRDGRFIAVDAVNAAPEFMTAKKLLLKDVAVTPEELADTSITMKELMARTKG